MEGHLHSNQTSLTSTWSAQVGRYIDIFGLKDLVVFCNIGYILCCRTKPELLDQMNDDAIQLKNILDKKDIISPDEGVVYLCTTQYVSTYINTFEVTNLIISVACYNMSVKLYNILLVFDNMSNLIISIASYNWSVKLYNILLVFHNTYHK